MSQKYFTLVIRADDEKAARSLVPGEKIGPNTITACALGNAITLNDKFKTLIADENEAKVSAFEQADLAAFNLHSVVAPSSPTTAPVTGEKLFANMPLTYQPEIWRVKKDTIYAATPALEAAIEHTTELLAKHDEALGRTTRKNRTWAEQLESDIRQMKDALAALRAEPQSRE